MPCSNTRNAVSNSREARVKILFDQGTPVPLRNALAAHEVATTFERGWQTLRNGELLTAAEAAGFEALITTDRQIRHQQNLDGRRIAILVLPTTDWRKIRNHTDAVAQAVASLVAGAYTELSFPEA
jgi:hypothetical protein